LNSAQIEILAGRWFLDNFDANPLHASKLHDKYRSIQPHPRFFRFQ
jgi:hypothetical protein